MGGHEGADIHHQACRVPTQAASQPVDLAGIARTVRKFVHQNVSDVSLFA
jgi:hypothetical protein